MKKAGTSWGAVHIGPVFRAFTGVRASHNDIHYILASNLVIAARNHPALRGAIQWQLRTGALRAVLPGVYALSLIHI